MVEGFGLGFGGWRSREGSLSFGGGGSRREELDFLRDGAAEIVELLVDITLAGLSNLLKQEMLYRF